MEEPIQGSSSTIHQQPQNDIQEETTFNANLTETPAVNVVRKLLFRRLLVGVKDGRFFVGSFHCLDKQGNLILQDTVEYRSIHRSSPSPMEQRCLGLVLIPFSCRTSCHVDLSLDEQLSMLSLSNNQSSTDEP
ncbi:uncharacterized protein LOC116258347 [Nymphaea colorata]|nr:uncharacterized protein LOC116258347 [Nymphaea colorata]